MSGMEVTPSVMVDPSTGEEIISYDHAVIKDYGHIDAVQRQHREQEQRAYYEDANGLHNRWADQLPEESEYEAYEEQVEEPQEDEDLYSDEEIDAFINDEVYEACGGREGYQELTEFARSEWTEKDIQAFNKCMDSGDIDLMRKAIGFLVDDFNEAVEEQQQYDYWSR